MSSPDPTVVIIGAGHAGDAMAAALRQYGFSGAITLLGAEKMRPYQRPPLSKAWLTDTTDAAALALRPADFYERQKIALRVGTSVTAIDRGRRRVVLAAKEALGYDWLVLAQGARPRKLELPGRHLAGVLTLRGLDDANALKARLVPGARLVVIGGGYIGLEVAASARALGAAVTVIEREAKILARVASAPLADFFQKFHQARGVDFVLAARVEEFLGHDGHVRGVHLASGDLIPADIVLVGVGAMPEEALARAAGLACDGFAIIKGRQYPTPCASRMPRFGRCEAAEEPGCVSPQPALPNLTSPRTQHRCPHTNRAPPCHRLRRSAGTCAVAQDHNKMVTVRLRAMLPQRVMDEEAGSL